MENIPDESTQEPQEANNRFQTINALLLALVTLLGAFVAWRASVAADASGDEALAGIIATIDAEETRAINNITLYENYRAFTTYTRYNTLGNAIEADLEKITDETEAATLDRQMREAWDTAESSSFPHRYLNRDGTYNTQRELGEAWADAARKKDIYPDPHFQTADRMQSKSNWLIVIVTALAGALVAYTVAEVLEKFSIRYVAMGLGVVLMVAGMVGLIVVEFAAFA